MLLDTNALIILMFGSVTEATLSEETVKAIEEAEELFVSEISFWEMAIKIRINKLNINRSLDWIVEQCRSNGINTIPVTTEQFSKTMELQYFRDHGDPFDRLIISVAKMRNMPLVSTDEKIRNHKDDYGVKLNW